MTSKDMKRKVEEVGALLADVSPEDRAEAASELAGKFDESLSAGQKRIAEDIFRVMLRDAEVLVRQALSETLKQNPAIPNDVATGLARDVAEVATPILRYSDVLTDVDLIEIVKGQSAEHQIAVAGRETVSETVADALVDSQNEAVVATLVGNEGAQLSEGTLQKVVDEFGDRETINAPMAKRKHLPLRIAERLVSLVSDSLREHLATHHELSADVATDLILESRERATITLLRDGADKADVMDLVDQLARHGRLTPTLMLRAICVGDIAFFEAALARLCDIPRANAYTLMSDHGPLGLRALCKRAGIPKDMVDFIRVAIDVACELDYDGGAADRERFVERMISRVLTTYEEGVDAENMDYLLRKLQTSVTAARQLTEEGRTAA